MVKIAPLLFPQCLGMMLLPSSQVLIFRENRTIEVCLMCCITDHVRNSAQFYRNLEKQNYEHSRYTTPCVE
ncbi:hypothetical protein F4679DRAFT_559858 [Xylaria curta]|nr:hypothetical protein F4679DRAFT_559858 [Xylaria curta]